MMKVQMRSAANTPVLPIAIFPTFLFRSGCIVITLVIPSLSLFGHQNYDLFNTLVYDQIPIKLMTFLISYHPQF